MHSFPIEADKKYRLLRNPSFSSTDRTGWIVTGKDMGSYMAVVDDLGVSWPPSEGDLEPYE